MQAARLTQPLSPQPETDLLALLVRRWWLIVLCLVIGLAVGLGFNVIATPSYDATAYVAVVPVNSSSATNAVSFASAYARIATAPSVSTSALAANGISIPADRVSDMVTVAASPDAPLIQIVASNPRPHLAQRIANAIAQGLTQYSTAQQVGTGYRAISFARAAQPLLPSSPNKKLDLLLGAVIGVLIGGASAIAAGSTSRRLRVSNPPRLRRSAAGSEAAPLDAARSPETAQHHSELS